MLAAAFGSATAPSCPTPPRGNDHRCCFPARSLAPVQASRVVATGCTIATEAVRMTDRLQPPTEEERMGL